MALLRAFDEQAVAYQRQGRIGTYAPHWGHEALQAGALRAMAATDWVFPSYRESAVGLLRGMPLADARAILPTLATRPADLLGGRTALSVLCRWVSRYAPMVAMDASDGLIADISGVPHLFGGEEALRVDLHGRLERA